LPFDCRINIISFLRPSELYSCYALVSRQSYEDTKCQYLPQVEWGEVYCGRTNLADFLKRISLPCYREAFRPPRKRLVLLGCENLTRSDLSCEELDDLIEPATLLHVTRLELSIPKSGGTTNVLVRSVPWALSKMFPNLRHLEMDNVHGGPISEGDLVSELSFFNNNTCPNLEIVQWKNRVGGCRFFRGNDMASFPALKEVYFDNIFADFRYDGEFSSVTFNFLFSGPEEQRCILFKCNKYLEKVSLLGAKVVDMNDESNDIIALPQSALMKFVRNTPSLKWFRSDLSESNIKELQQERPNVIFCTL